MESNPPKSSRDLLIHAFSLAQKAGKEQWWAMSTPVLKNRLLMITNRRFNEADYGASSLRDFLIKNAETVELDESLKPAVVTLKEIERSAAPTSARKHNREPRVRTDLWRATLDYSSHLKYVWDVADGVAKPTDGDLEGQLILPTTTEAEFDSWRDEFIGSLGPLGTLERDRLEMWKGKRLPSALIPMAFRGKWNVFLKQRVLSRLDGWFKGHAIEVPSLLEEPASSALENAVQPHLRALVNACIGVMSDIELAQLQIPLGVISRIMAKREI